MEQCPALLPDAALLPSMTQVNSTLKNGTAIYGTTAEPFWDLRWSKDLFSIGPGAYVSVSCLTLLNVSLLSPVGSQALPFLEAFSSSSAQLVKLENVQLVTSCSSLYAYQSEICNRTMAWDLKVNMTGVFVHHLEAGSGIWRNVSVTCRPNNSDLLKTPPCSFNYISSMVDLLDVTASFPDPLPLHVLILAQNVTIFCSSGGVAAPVDQPMWPENGPQLSKTVVLTSGSGSRRNSLDVNLCKNVFRLRANTTFIAENVAIENLPKVFYPLSVRWHSGGTLTTGHWWLDRYSEPGVTFTLINVTEVVPSDELKYYQYYATLLLSPIPELAMRAVWVASQNFTVDNDNNDAHSLHIRFLAGIGYAKYDCVMTDIPFWAPQLNTIPFFGAITPNNQIPPTLINCAIDSANLIPALGIQYKRTAYGQNLETIFTITPFVVVVVNSMELPTEWPEESYPITKNGFLQGMPGKSVYFDVKGRPFAFLVQPGATLTIRNLVILNLPVVGYMVNKVPISYPSCPHSTAPSFLPEERALQSALWTFGICKSKNEIVLEDVTLVVSLEEQLFLNQVAHMVNNLPHESSTSMANGMWNNVLAKELAMRMKGSAIELEHGSVILTDFYMAFFRASSLVVTSHVANVSNMTLLPSNVDYIALQADGAGPTPNPPFGASRSISSSATIAIAVSVSVGVCLLIAIVGLLFLWRRKHEQVHDPGDPSGTVKVQIGNLIGVCVGNLFITKQRSQCGGTSLTPNVEACSLGTSQNKISIPSTGVDGNTPSSSILQNEPIPYKEISALIDSLNKEFNDPALHVQDILGSGSYGVVYRGTWRGLDVAIKTLLYHVGVTPDRLRQRNMLEAAIGSTLSHPNVVATYTHIIKPLTTMVAQHGVAAPDNVVQAREVGVVSDVAVSGWKLFIVQELCEGGPLKNMIDSGFFQCHTFGPPSSTSTMKEPQMVHVLSAVLQIARGLNHIHSKNIIHGDLNPANVLLKPPPVTLKREASLKIPGSSQEFSDQESEISAAEGWTLKITDFGLSLILNDGQTHFSNIRQGTPHYIAPEVVSQGLLSQAADVYSFGVIMWELVYGTPAWRAPGLRARFFATPLPKPEELLFPDTCPGVYCDLCRCCLSQVVSDRPPLSGIIQQLQELLLEYAPNVEASSYGNSSGVAPIPINVQTSGLDPSRSSEYQPAWDHSVVELGTQESGAVAYGN